MITDFHHASITVQNLERSVAFYRDVLGMEYMFERDVIKGYVAEIVGYPDVHQRQAWLRGGGEKLELIQYLSPEGKPIDGASYNPGTLHLAFEVDDIHAMYKRLQELGVKTRSAPVAIVQGPHKGGYAMYVYDPDGVSIELMQLPAQPAS